MRNVTHVICSVFILLSTSVLASAQSQLDVMREAMRNTETDISFYGKVLDQYDALVEGATVEVDITHASAITGSGMAVSTLKARTDQDGLFSVEGQRGWQVYIHGVSKEGYEYLLTSNPNHSFRYSKEVPTLFVPDKSKPILFRLRKRGETAALFLTRGGSLPASFKKAASGSLRVFDLIRGTWTADASKLALNGEPIYPDFQVLAAYDEKSTSWTVVISSGLPGGGIIASDELLYEAPLQGYKPEFQFIAHNRKSPARYLYLRSREPAIYSRIQISNVAVDPASDNRLAIYFGEVLTNPYGDRTLDQEPYLPYSVWRQLTDEAREAFRKDQRPTKPDLPALIREAKEKEAVSGAGRGR